MIAVRQGRRMLWVVSVLVGVLLTGEVLATEYYVTPAGNDSNPGTKAKPFASLDRARDAARQAKGATVVLAPGTYRLTKTFALDERDSHPTYTSHTSHDSAAGARITGSVSIPNSAVKPVTDKAILDRLLPEVRGKVTEIDRRKPGITDFGEIGPRGFLRPYVPAPLELIVDGEPLTLSRWPNPGEPGIPSGRVLDKGPVTRNGQRPTRGGVFLFSTERPMRWKQAKDAWITGIFNAGWADDTTPLLPVSEPLFSPSCAPTVKSNFLPMKQSNTGPETWPEFN